MSAKMPLTGRNILVAEDEILISLNITRIIREAGSSVSSVAYVEDGLALNLYEFDAAVLDVSLIDGEVFELADRLREIGIPFVFHSGHAHDLDVLNRYPEAAILDKPAPHTEIVDMLTWCLGDDWVQEGVA